MSLSLALAVVCLDLPAELGLVLQGSTNFCVSSLLADDAENGSMFLIVTNRPLPCPHVKYLTPVFLKTPSVSP